MIKGYYFITDSSLSKAGNVSDVRNAVEAGVKTVQYRNKNGTTRDVYSEASELRKICWGVTYIINDRVDIALAVDADGVHIGQEDLPFAIARKILGKNKIIGLTVHDVAEARVAQRLGADYLGVSPVYATGTKPDAGKPSGVELLKEIKKIVTIPVIAIGGITPDNAPPVIDAGADGLCSISAVVTKKDVGAEIRKFQKLFERKI